MNRNPQGAVRNHIGQETHTVTGGVYVLLMRFRTNTHKGVSHGIPLTVNKNPVGIGGSWVHPAQLSPWFTTVPTARFAVLLRFRFIRRRRRSSSEPPMPPKFF